MRPAFAVEIVMTKAKGGLWAKSDFECVFFREKSSQTRNKQNIE
jgi:hypothetical protein